MVQHLYGQTNSILRPAGHNEAYVPVTSSVA